MRALHAVNEFFQRMYSKWELFYERWAVGITLLWGGLILFIASFLGVVAIQVYAQQASEHARKVKESETVAISCVRSKIFGPPLIKHIKRVEERLHTGALEDPVEWPPGSGEKVNVLDFYYATIPLHCPPLPPSAVRRVAPVAGH